MSALSSIVSVFSGRVVSIPDLRHNARSARPKLMRDNRLLQRAIINIAVLAPTPGRAALIRRAMCASHEPMSMGYKFKWR